MELLPLIWAAFLGLAVTLYVLLDGFSLGIGILFPFADSDAERDLMMASVAPVWDGNQTWLVGGGAALFGAFPQAFNILLGALYLPLMLMLLALVFRGVAFEFRAQARRQRRWNLAFCGGSILAAFAQGAVLGTYVRGFVFDGEQLLTSPLAWLQPFALLTGLGVVLAYALLGACWLILKTEGELQARARAWGRRLLPAVAGVIIAVCLASPALVPAIAARWLTWPNLLLLSPLPLWMVVVAGALLWSLRQAANDLAPYLLCIALYLLTIAGFVVSLWPYLVPRQFSFWELAAPPESLLFMLVGVLLIVPVVLVYTAHAFYVFRGKVRAEDNAH